jgi:precorrin-6Y C5,15-methyltransferase (decarboxylating)
MEGAEHVRAVFESTGCVVVMLARGALGNPWLFAQVLGTRSTEPSRAEVLEEWRWVLDRAVEHLGPVRAARYLRKFHPWYVQRLGEDRHVQAALQQAETIAEQRALPSPLEALFSELAAGEADGVCVLASGDPMLHGIGASLARRLGPDRLDVHPHASAFALACARLGWPAADVELVSAVGRAPEAIARVLQPGRRIVAYVTGEDGARELASVVADRGFGASRFVVLERLGGSDERLTDATAQTFAAAADPLHAVAVEVADGPLRPLVPGLPDDAYETDGQLTKRHVRAATLAALAPLPGALLWDVGAGSGSIGIEWLRSERSARAIAIEADTARAERIERNALALGVPDRLTVVRDRAPEALASLERPAAAFIGGGVAASGMLDACWSALRSGGRLVANAVTFEGEQALVSARSAHGGTLTRIEIARAEPIGRFTGWHSQRPVVQWAAVKP